MMIYWLIGGILSWALLEAWWEQRRRARDPYWMVNDR
jgi:hypothetical protein